LRLSNWLEGESIEGFSFDWTRWIERPEVDAEELADALGREVLDNYADREWLERRLERLGYDQLAAHIRDTLLPPPATPAPVTSERSSPGSWCADTWAS